jgi:hypothetical protein
VSDSTVAGASTPSATVTGVTGVTGDSASDSATTTGSSLPRSSSARAHGAPGLRRPRPGRHDPRRMAEASRRPAHDRPRLVDVPAICRPPFRHLSGPATPAGRQTPCSSSCRRGIRRHQPSSRQSSPRHRRQTPRRKCLAKLFRRICGLRTTHLSENENPPMATSCRKSFLPSHLRRFSRAAPRVVN